MQWYRIDPAKGAVVQQGRYGEPGAYHYFPALATTAGGDALMVFGRSSPSDHAHLRATGRTCAGISVPDRFQPTLDEAYRNAFFLCRAKGISDAAAAAGKASAPGAREAAKFMLEYGLGREGSAKARRSATASEFSVGGVAPPRQL